MSWRSSLRQLLGRDAEVVVVSFLSGPEDLALAMLKEVCELTPSYRHFAVMPAGFSRRLEGVEFFTLEQVKPALRGKRIGLAPFLLGVNERYSSLRYAAVRRAPRKLLAYNAQLERHHLRLNTWIASLLFVRGVPLDRIWLRPKWFPFGGERTIAAVSYREWPGRPVDPARRRVAVLTPYFPFPLSHGGAVRIYNLLRETSKHFDLFLFSFGSPEPADVEPLAKICARIWTVPDTRYREPRWSTLLPPEVHERESPLLRELIARARSEWKFELLQVEYTQLAAYPGDILVEHDITFDLQRQVLGQQKSLDALWSWRRWSRFERKALRRFRAVVVMSEKDRTLSCVARAHVIPNGVDMNRFRPEEESPARNVLFVGSFRHFPNADAYRFLADEIWPLVLEQVPDARLTVIAGPSPERYAELDAGPSVTIHGFVDDPRPFYSAANVVVVPTRVSAGTNLKVLEAMAMRRAIVSTSSGCAGIELVDGESARIAAGASAFAGACAGLLGDADERRRLAEAAYDLCRARFDWQSIGRKQRVLWNRLLGVPEPRVRAGQHSDLERIREIEASALEAAQWPADDYLRFDLHVAEIAGEIAGFMVSRDLAGDREILNLAVAPEFRRRGAATALIESQAPRGALYLEVRESNASARALYRASGFAESGYRPGYYDDPPEGAIVMKKEAPRA